MPQRSSGSRLACRAPPPGSQSPPRSAHSLHLESRQRALDPEPDHSIDPISSPLSEFSGCPSTSPAVNRESAVVGRRSLTPGREFGQKELSPAIILSVKNGSSPYWQREC